MEQIGCIVQQSLTFKYEQQEELSFFVARAPDQVAHLQAHWMIAPLGDRLYNKLSTLLMTSF
jgi:hypothetical protein